MSLSNPHGRNFFLVMLFALLPLTAWSETPAVPTKAVEIHLDADVKVGGEQVVLGDVATIYAKSMQNFHALSSLVISRIPDDKQEVRLPASYLEARVRAALPPGIEFALHAPKEVIFRLERLGFGTAELTAEISRLGRQLGKIPANIETEVLALSGMDQLSGFKPSTTRIEPAGEMARWKGEMSFKLSRTDGAGVNPPVWVRAKVRWFQQAWLSSRSISFTETPNPDLFVLGKVETTALREDPIVASANELPALLLNARVKRMIPGNSPLVPSQIERKPDATAGAALRVVFVSEGGVRVSADGALVSAGSIGGDVKARLRSSKKVVTGKLISQNLVEVNL